MDASDRYDVQPMDGVLGAWVSGERPAYWFGPPMPGESRKRVGGGVKTVLLTGDLSTGCTNRG